MTALFQAVVFAAHAATYAESGQRRPVRIGSDFSLVKQCEHPDCILWFYDRTKARKRRWCSMAVCGNRHKAAQFRKRNRGKPAESKTIASKD